MRSGPDPERTYGLPAAALLAHGRVQARGVQMHVDVDVVPPGQRRSSREPKGQGRNRCYPRQSVHDPSHGCTIAPGEQFSQQSPGILQTHSDRNQVSPSLDLFYLRCHPTFLMLWVSHVGSPFGRFSRHPDTPLSLYRSFFPRRGFPRPSPVRGLVTVHGSAAGFPETGPGHSNLGQSERDVVTVRWRLPTPVSRSSAYGY